MTWHDTLDDPNELERRKIGVFMAVAFGVAWAAALVVFVTGGVQGSERIVPDLPVTFYAVVVPTFYMWAPSLGHVAARLATGEGWDWDATMLYPRLRGGWPYWLAGWFMPAVFAVVGAAAFFALYPGTFDGSAANIVANLDLPGVEFLREFPGGKWGFVGVRVAQTVLLVSLFNSIFAFGEEFGWRGYLLPKLMPLGGRTASVVVGVVWGVWHWPLIMMGHNYGLDYPGAPWLGMLAMLWFTVIAGVFLGWITIRSGSVWPAVIAHGANNAIFSLGAFFAAGDPNPLIGPTFAGVVGSVGWSLFVAWLLFRPGSSSVFNALRSETGTGAGS